MDGPLTDSDIPDYALILLNQIASNEGFLHYMIHSKPGSSHGDGFMGVVSRITITGSRKTRPYSITLILKTPPADPIRRKELNVDLYFQQEIFAYERFLPTIRQFQNEKGLDKDNGFFRYPKCYGTINDNINKNYCLVLEDLNNRDFRMWNKFHVIDLDHAEMVLKELAKLHAICLALRDQKPEIFEEFRQIHNCVLDAIHATGEEQYRNTCFDLTIASLEPNDSKAISLMQALKDNYYQHTEECYSPDNSEPFTVINHGDLWTNNTMFSYDKDNKVNDIRIIDWQVIHAGSPALDILYFMFISTHKEFRDKHFNYLINTYYEQLAATIQKAGSNPTNIISFKDLQNQLKKFGKFALLMTPELVQIICADPTDIPDLNEMAKISQLDNVDFDVFLNENTRNNYNIRMRNIVNDIIDLGCTEDI